MIINTGLTSQNKPIVYDRDDNLLRQINVLHSRLLEFTPTGDKKNAVLSEAFYSSLLAGANTTQSEVNQALSRPSKINTADRQSAAPSLSSGTQMVVNTLRALKRIYSGETISISNFNSFYETLAHKINEPSSLVPHMRTILDGGTADILRSLSEFLFANDCNGIEKAIVTHFYLAYVQPYAGATDRLARLLQNYLLLIYGYNKIQFLSVSTTIWNNKAVYLQIFKNILFNASSEKVINITQFMQYMLNAISHTCLQNETQLDNSILKCYSELCEYVNAEFTSKEAAQKMKTSIDTARTILNLLTDKGLLEKHKSGNKNMYKIHMWG